MYPFSTLNDHWRSLVALTSTSLFCRLCSLFSALHRFWLGWWCCPWDVQAKPYYSPQVWLLISITICNMIQCHPHNISGFPISCPHIQLHIQGVCITCSLQNLKLGSIPTPFKISMTGGSEAVCSPCIKVNAVIYLECPLYPTDSVPGSGLLGTAAHTVSIRCWLIYVYILVGSLSQKVHYLKVPKCTSLDFFGC